MKKGQSATEYLIILSIIIIIVGTLMSSAFEMLTSSQIKTRNLQAKDLINEIGKGSELVFQEGKNSKTKVFVTIPPGITGYRKTGRTLVMNISLGDDTVPFIYPLNFPFTINLSKSPNNYWLNITSNGTGVIIE